MKKFRDDILKMLSENENVSEWRVKYIKSVLDYFQHLHTMDVLNMEGRMEMMNYIEGLLARSIDGISHRHF